MYTLNQCSLKSAKSCVNISCQVFNERMSLQHKTENIEHRGILASKKKKTKQTTTTLPHILPFNTASL